jgi:hypothetical protein
MVMEQFHSIVGGVDDVKVAVISRGQGILCEGDPSAGVSVGFVLQCPWEVQGGSNMTGTDFF